MSLDVGISSQEEIGHDSICDVCSSIIKYYAVGICDHPICMKCSVKMRVISGDFDCAICRTDMDKVHFMITKLLDYLIFLNILLYLLIHKYKLYTLLISDFFLDINK